MGNVTPLDIFVLSFFFGAGVFCWLWIAYMIFKSAFWKRNKETEQ